MTRADIEIVAIALFNSDAICYKWETPWSALQPHHREPYRDLARAMLTEPTPA